MGEIKSTLDLVLEKTRHLSQTDEEKQVQKQKDIANRLNGSVSPMLRQAPVRHNQPLPNTPHLKAA